SARPRGLNPDVAGNRCPHHVSHSLSCTDPGLSCLAAINAVCVSYNSAFDSSRSLPHTHTHSLTHKPTRAHTHTHTHYRSLRADGQGEGGTDTTSKTQTSALISD